MKLRRLHKGGVLEDGDVMLVRGGELDPEVLREDAVRYHRTYGVYGISVFAGVVRRADVPRLSAPVSRCPVAWQQYWQQPEGQRPWSPQVLISVTRS